MATPGVNLTVNLQAIFGALPGSAHPKVRTTLCGYGQTLPHVDGTANLVQVQLFTTVSSGTVVIPLYGNYQIDPVGTFYEIALIDDFGNVAQAGMYQFDSGGSFELDNLTQIFPTPPPPIFGFLYVVPINGGTPVFNYVKGLSQSLTLTENVTSSTAINFPAGLPFGTFIKQDGTGGRTFVWPANFMNVPEIDPAPDAVTSQLWIKDEVGNFYPFGGAIWS